MRVGDIYESSGGLTFTITLIEADEIHVDVDRVVRDRDRRKTIETRKRVIPRRRFDLFASPYKKKRNVKKT